MSAFNTILTVAQFERKTLLRSWFFRIFAGLFIVGIGIFNAAVFIESSGSPWLFRALPASLPYANLIILNLGQAIVAVFLASEFLKQDRKNDTVEVIYARSMTNLQYILGKTLGILAVFIILNFIVLIIGIGFSFFSGDSAKGIIEFFLYPILISIPTLTFILGLSFFMMTIIRNQAMTFILILGYIALTVFYLNEKYFHLFDYIAYNVPMLSSSIGGFGNLNELLLHRGLYFLIGAGLVMFTVFKIQRLPQTDKYKYLPLIAALVFVFSGFFLGYKYVGIKKAVIEQKKEMISVNNKYAFEPRVYVHENKIDIKHNGSSIEAKSTLTVSNNNDKDINNLIFSLNPSLEITRIEIDGKETAFSREQHLIHIKCETSISPESKREIVFYYNGTINENTHHLDINPDDYKDYMSLQLYKARKRFAYIQSDFVCLTSESLWYPTAGATYATVRPAYYQPDFTKFSLNVTTRDNLMAISQGEVKHSEGGAYEFINDYPLPKISLLIGEYNKLSINVDSVEYSIYSTKGNDFYLKQFTTIHDTLPAIIRELRVEFESLLELKYGFKRFALAEVPINFSLDKHIWSIASDAVQPEIMFYPEKGVIMEETDFKKRRSRFEKQMKQNNEEVTPEELEVRILKRFARGNFMSPPTEWFEYSNVVDKYTYSLIPNYYSFITNLQSDKWPIVNLALEAYLRERNAPASGSAFSFQRGIFSFSKDEKINLELKQSSLADLIKKGIEKEEQSEGFNDPLRLNDLILAKGDFLFSLFRSEFGNKEFNGFLNNMVENNKHKPIAFSTFDSEISKRFNRSISTDIDSWYSEKQLPGFIIKDLQTYKVLDGEFTKYQVRLSVANPEQLDGVVVVTINLDEKSNARSFTSDQPRQPDFTKRVFIPAGTAKEIGAVFQTQPKNLSVFTGISENLPNLLEYELTTFDETKKTKPIEGEVNIPLFSSLTSANEFVVDNEDEGFSITQKSNETYLKSLFKSEKKSRYKYSGLRFWNPPSQWEAILRSGFYGKYVRSASYTASGDGESFVQWNAKLPQGAYYDVYCHLAKVIIPWSRDKVKSNYNFRIFHDDGMEEVTLTDEEIENGWTYMGTFYISPENAKVELTNKSLGKMIFADAVKWVKK
jgi:ABC-type transport system involved in multi-copper enzyme maturation permease subunit